MALPSNLIPTNISSVTTTVTSLTGNAQSLITAAAGAVPTNLLPSNLSTIGSNLQSIGGELPNVLQIPEIPQFSVLNAALPDSLFETGSIDQIKDAATSKAEDFIASFAPAIPIFALPVLSPPNPLPRPSIAQIKNFIKTKIDRIKAQRQAASVRALREELKAQQNPFEYRQQLKNTQLATLSQQISNIPNNFRG